MPPKGIKVLSAKGIVSSYYQFLSDTQRYAAHIIKFLIIDNVNAKLRQEVAKRDKEIDELKVKMQQMQKQHGKQIRDL